MKFHFLSTALLALVTESLWTTANAEHVPVSFTDLTPEELALPHEELVAILKGGSGGERNLRNAVEMTDKVGHAWKENDLERNLRFDGKNRRELIEVITDRPTLLSRYPNLALEDFEGGNGVPLQCSNPLVGGAGDPCFPAGVTETGFEVVSYGYTTNGVNARGFDSGSGSSTWVGSEFYFSATKLRFTAGDVNAVGVDLLDSFGDKTITVSVYGEGNSLIAEVDVFIPSSPLPAFFGVVSNEPIVEVILGNENDFMYLDNLVFGFAQTDSPSAPPSTSPSTSTSPSAAPTLIKERCLSCDQDDKGKVTFCRNGKTTMKIPSQAVEAIVSSSDDCICGACPELN